MFVDNEELKLGEEFIYNGFIKKPIINISTLDLIKKNLIEIIKSYDLTKNSKDVSLENIHEIIPIEDLNNFRLFCINEISKKEELRVAYYHVFKNYTDQIIGNELAMQKKLNLSIQMPKDTSSLLTIHADTWSGDSPFETVCWLPMVDCIGTMSMFILPAYNYEFFSKKYNELKHKNSDELFEALREKLIWLEIKYGEVLIFNQNLPHGNVVNEELKSRWSFNCRFKSIFTPYKDKKIGEFFEPITLKPTSKIGLKYKFPS
ncbi:2OG-Fe(II) oxygenase [Alphaproteobacteria bacterium]|nr:2OG-Fe(II) oxygenase [Alphaproteobacteria bacterium]